MVEKTEVVLDLSVDQGSMITELERTKKAIIGLKEEQQALTKAYKAGDVTLEEYASESVRLEAILKKQQSTYSNTQKAVTGVKTSMDKLNDSIKAQSQNVTIAGTNVSQLGQKFTQLATPVGAAIGFVTALGAAYARSTIGAKDLAFASNQLGSAITLITNDLASLVSSAEDGEGALTKFLNFFLKVNPLIGTLDKLGITNIAEDSKKAALALEQLEDLQREEILIRGDVAERLGDNQEIISEINQEQTKFNRKLELTQKLQDNIRRNTNELLVVKGEELKKAQEILDADSENEDKQRNVNILSREVDKILLDQSKKLKTVDVLTDNIKTNEEKRLSAIRKQREETEKKIKAQDEADTREFKNREVSFDDDPTAKDFDPQEQFERDRELINADVDLVRTAEQEKQTALLQTNATKEMIAEQDRQRNADTLSQTKENFTALADLFTAGSEARRVFALGAIGVDTAEAISAATAAAEKNPFNAATFSAAGIAQFAASIIRIFANMAAAKSFLGGNFAGGADFVTSKPTMIMVGDNPGGRERVTVQPLSGRGKSNYNPRSGFANFAGGGSMTFDGASASANATVTQALMQSNAIKNMPAPVVSAVEITRVQRRVRVKEQVSRG